LSPGEFRFGGKGRVGGVGRIDGHWYPATVEGSLGSTSGLSLLRYY
jgi:hypothetical protein